MGEAHEGFLIFEICRNECPNFEPAAWWGEEWGELLAKNVEKGCLDVLKSGALK